MLCSSCLRSVFRNLGRYTDVLHLNDIRKVQRVNNFRDLKLLSIIGRKMMVDTNSTAKDGDGGYASGGLKSEDGGLSCGYSSFRGKRMSMEDFYDIKTSTIEGKTVSLFGIFDGHGGSRAAEFLKGHLFENLMKHPEFISNTKLAISETYQKTDNDFLESEKETLRDDGSTASTAVLVGNHLYVANVGDSRTIISKAGQVIPLSDDHKPNRSDERKRIENAGGIIMWAGTWRVGGVLAMSRAFGNRMLKQFVVAEPEIQDMEINEELELLVLASDGLWDVVANEDAISLARQEEEPEKAARKLTETAFNRGSADNITCIVVKFHHAKKTGSDPVSTEQVNKPVGLNPESSEIDCKPTGLNPETLEKDCKPTGLNPESSEKDYKPPDGLKNPESSEKDCKPDGLKNPESSEKDCKPDGVKNPESSQQQSGLGPVRSEQVNKSGEKN